jgi:ABC-type Zn uptake system ZnuABC Zn-binding protein ZnuA
MIRLMNRSVVLVLSALLLSLVSCRTAGAPGAGSAAAGGGGRPLVLTSVTVLADLVNQVGGERIEVRALVPSGADPNTFQPPPRAVMDAGQARLVIFNGLGLERTVRSVVGNAERGDLPLVVLSEGLPTLDSGLAPAVSSASGGRGNPYLWLDPRLATVYVERIRDALIGIDPDGEPQYRSNASEYIQRLDAIDREVDSTLAALPPARRRLISLHDAFPYFAARYGFELLAVVIQTPGRTPTAQEVARVVGVISQEHVPAVFIEPQLDARLLKLAARDAGVKIGTLYSDTLDKTVPSYEALLRYNARQLLSGLR